jgi:hypothetical protein
MREDAHPFAPVWNKYRPVIIKLMSEAANGPQEYQLYVHEFKAFSKKDKGGFSFSLEAHNGKAVNNIKTSQVAQDLLFILQQSKTALQLLREGIYEFSMDKSFILKINKKETAAAV